MRRCTRAAAALTMVRLPSEVGCLQRVSFVDLTERLQREKRRSNLDTIASTVSATAMIFASGSMSAAFRARGYPDPSSRLMMLPGDISNLPGKADIFRIEYPDQESRLCERLRR